MLLTRAVMPGVPVREGGRNVQEGMRLVKMSSLSPQDLDLTPRATACSNNEILASTDAQKVSLCPSNQSFRLIHCNDCHLQRGYVNPVTETCKAGNPIMTTCKQQVARQTHRALHTCRIAKSI